MSAIGSGNKKDTHTRECACVRESRWWPIQITERRRTWNSRIINNRKNVYACVCKWLVWQAIASLDTGRKAYVERALLFHDMLMQTEGPASRLVVHFFPLRCDYNHVICVVYVCAWVASDQTNLVLITIPLFVFVHPPMHELNTQ